MKEIKFKVWDKVEGRWLDAPWIRDGVFNLYDSSNGFIEGRHIIIQYTGLKDKNEVEIYEGDVMGYSLEDNDRDWNSDGKRNFPVIFEDGEFRVDFGRYKTPVYSVAKNKKIIMEVIGNIYENSELDPRYKELKDDKIMETAREVKDGIKESHEEIT